MITLLVTLTLVGVCAWALLYIGDDMPVPIKRIIVAVAVLLAVLLVLGYFGYVKTPRLVAMAYGQEPPVAVAIATPAPSILADREVKGIVVALIVAIGWAGIAWARKVGADADRSREETELARLKTARERAELEQQQAEIAKDMVKEMKARDGLTDKEAEETAVAEFQRRVPSASKEHATSAVIAAVGADPDIGKSSKGGDS